MTDRELLQSCLGAMREAQKSQAKGIQTDWSLMIVALEKRLAECDHYSYPRSEAHEGRNFVSRCGNCGAILSTLTNARPDQIGGVD